MSKQKEMTIYLTSQDFSDMERGEAFVVSPNDGKYKKHKGKLIIELPEKEIKLTESEFDELILKIGVERFNGYRFREAAIINDLRQRLFRDNT